MAVALTVRARAANGMSVTRRRRRTTTPGTDPIRTAHQVHTPIRLTVSDFPSILSNAAFWNGAYWFQARPRRAAATTGHRPLCSLAYWTPCSRQYRAFSEASPGASPNSARSWSCQG